MSEKRIGGNFFMEKTKNMFLTSAKELKTTSTLAVCAMLCNPPNAYSKEFDHVAY